MIRREQAVDASDDDAIAEALAMPELMALCDEAMAKLGLEGGKD